MVTEPPSVFEWAELSRKVLLRMKCWSFLIAVMHLCLVDNAGALSYGAFASHGVGKGQTCDLGLAKLGH